ncbi:hypothetical protein Tco_0863997 [Tanacetum coccineum]
MPTTRQGLSSAAIEQLIAQRVADVLTAYVAKQNIVKVAKRKLDDNQRGNSGQQNKRQEVVRAFTEGSSEKKGYAGTAPHCNRCKLHHNRPYTIQCKNCKRVGQRIGDCKTPTLATAATTQRTLVTFFECGVKGHFRSECTQLKNQGGGNQNGDERAHGRVFVIGGGESR